MTVPRNPLASFKRSVRHNLPRRRLQPFFIRLHGWSLAGMGIGSAVWTFDESGESHFIERFAAWAERRQLGSVTCLDVGANTGGYTDLLLDAVGARCEVHCFEPARDTFEQLRNGTGRRSGVTLHHTALGSTPGEAPLHIVPGHSQLASLHPFTDKPTAAAETTAVDTLDAFCASHDIGRVHLLKIDVEGAESGVLEGAASLLDRGAIDLVQFEFGARNLTAGASLRTFFDLLDGYRIHRMVIDGLTPVQPYHESLEIPISATNYVAIRDDLEEI